MFTNLVKFKYFRRKFPCSMKKEKKTAFLMIFELQETTESWSRLTQFLNIFRRHNNATSFGALRWKWQWKHFEGTKPKQKLKSRKIGKTLTHTVWYSYKKTCVSFMIQSKIAESFRFVAVSSILTHATVFR